MVNRSAQVLWTTEFPKTPGYYWVRKAIKGVGLHVYLIEVYADKGRIRVATFGSEKALGVSDFPRNSKRCMFSVHPVTAPDALVIG